MAGKKFCSECGQETEKLAKSLCSNCYFKGKQYIQIPKKLKGEVCRKCSKVFIRGSWKPLKSNQDEAIYEAAYASVEKELKITPLDEYHIEIQPGSMKKFSDTVFLVPVEIILTGKEGDLDYSEVTTREVRIILPLCPTCTRENSRYFEAILQVRGEEKLADDFLTEIDEYVRDLMYSMKNEKNAFISDFTQLKGGLDYYIGSNRVASKIAANLVSKYGGNLGESAKLVGKRDGRDMFRVSYSVRLSALRDGDIIDYNNRLFQVIKIMGKRIRVFGLAERRISSVDMKDIDKSNIKLKRNDYIRGIVVEAIPGRVQIMDFKEFKTFYLDTNLPLKVQDEYDIIRMEEREYLLLTEFD